MELSDQGSIETWQRFYNHAVFWPRERQAESRICDGLIDTW